MEGFLYRSDPFRDRGVEDTAVNQWRLGIFCSDPESQRARRQHDLAFGNAPAFQELEKGSPEWEKRRAEYRETLEQMRVALNR